MYQDGRLNRQQGGGTGTLEVLTLHAMRQLELTVNSQKPPRELPVRPSSLASIKVQIMPPPTLLLLISLAGRRSGPVLWHLASVVENVQDARWEDI